MSIAMISIDPTLETVLKIRYPPLVTRGSSRWGSGGRLGPRAMGDKVVVLMANDEDRRLFGC